MDGWMDGQTDGETDSYGRAQQLTMSSSDNIHLNI